MPLDSGGYWILVGLVGAGPGFGVGAIIGVQMNNNAADTRVIYAASTPSVRVVPTLTPTRAGVSLAMRW